MLARARLGDATGDPGGALEAIAGPFDALAEAGAATFLPALGPDLARLAVAAGQPDRAARVVPEVTRVADCNPGARSLAAGPLLAHGLLAGDADALSEAVELLRAAGRALEAARAAEDIGTVARLEDARAAYERGGATRDLARTDAALRALGVHRGVKGRRRRPATGWDALTDTELKVVRLVAERLTNPEIAERMFISRRTVQTHVSHALAKLGVDSRRALAAEAARRAGWRIRVEGGGEEPQQSEPSVEAPGARAVDLDDA